MARRDQGSSIQRRWRRPSHLCAFAQGTPGRRLWPGHAYLIRRGTLYQTSCSVCTMSREISTAEVDSPRPLALDLIALGQPTSAGGQPTARHWQMLKIALGVVVVLITILGLAGSVVSLRGLLLLKTRDPCASLSGDRQALAEIDNTAPVAIAPADFSRIHPGERPRAEASTWRGRPILAIEVPARNGCALRLRGRRVRLADQVRVGVRLALQHAQRLPAIDDEAPVIVRGGRARFRRSGS
jgi:hypothetical protein